MKVPLSWLRSYVPVALPPRELAERLTMSGSLVERVENTGETLREIVVARVVRLERHPNAEKLWLATLELGDREQTVVTGAQNLSVGALVPFIGVGKRLPGSDAPLEGKMLRGVRSEGMVCSGAELGLSEDHSGILILDEMLADRGGPNAVGASLADLLGETVLDIEITPNRPDCLSVYGIAREVAAITGAQLAPLASELREGQVAVDTLASVRIEAPDLCRRLTARAIEGVTIGPSPAWLVERLLAARVRSINNVVDVTNYVMLELGQPLHAYDLDKLAGHALTARRALDGERIATLDGAQRHLSAEMLVIADANGAVGVAGVMGGGDSEVSASTTRILLEAATFNARSIRRTSIALGLRSEASGRFEKGLPTALAPIALVRAAQLIADLAGGTVAAGMLDAGEPQAEAQQLDFDPSEVRRLLGVEWPLERITGNLGALGFLSTPLHGDVLTVTVPWWRQDIDGTADLVEEVARVTGFDAIPETLLSGSVPQRPTSVHERWYAPTRQLLLGCGFSEGSSPGLATLQGLEWLRPEGSGPGWLAEIVPNPEPLRAAGTTFEPVRVVNPLSPEREILRPTLLPGLLDALRDNLRNGEDRAAFFEIDFCAFARPGQLPVQRRTLAIAMAGLRQQRQWSTPDVPTDFYDLKGVVEQVLIGLGATAARIVAGQHALLHPGRAALLMADGAAIGFMGELYPSVAQRWDLGTARAYVAEFDFEALAALASDARLFVDYPRVPIARRDLAVVVDEAMPAETVLSVIREAGKDLVARITLFDVYRGEQLPPGTKSLACALELQAGDRTLSEAEIEKAVGRIGRALQHRAGAAIRGV